MPFFRTLTDIFTNVNTMAMMVAAPFLYWDTHPVYTVGIMAAALSDRSWFPVAMAVKRWGGNVLSEIYGFASTPVVLMLEACVLLEASTALQNSMMGPVTSTLGYMAWMGAMSAMNLLWATVGVFYVGWIMQDVLGMFLENIEEFSRGEAIALNVGFRPQPFVTIINPRPMGFPSEEALEELAPLQKFVESKPPEDRQECAVCLDDISKTDGLWRILPCKGRHCFHAHCVDSWLLTHDSCPTCREIIKQYAEAEDDPYVVAALAEETSDEEDVEVD